MLLTVLMKLLVVCLTVVWIWIYIAVIISD